MGRVALLGDASGSVDAITGEGLSLAFLEARALADSLARDSLAYYEKMHAQIFRRSRLMARMLTTLSKHDGLRRRVLHALSGQPDVFANLLGFHVGQQSLCELEPAQLFRFGRGFLRACTAE
jgi:flavin-dependent dehydrogenase